MTTLKIFPNSILHGMPAWFWHGGVMMMVMLLEEADAGKRKRKSKGRLVKDRSNNGLAITIFNPMIDCDYEKLSKYLKSENFEWRQAWWGWRKVMNMDEKKKKCENEEEDDVSEALLPITCACTVGSCQVLFVNLTSPQPLSSLFIQLFICLSWFDRSSRLERWRSSNEWNQRFRSSPCRIKTRVHLFVLFSPIGALYAIVV